MAIMKSVSAKRLLALGVERSEILGLAWLAKHEGRKPASALRKHYRWLVRRDGRAFGPGDDIAEPSPACEGDIERRYDGVAERQIRDAALGLSAEAIRRCIRRKSKTVHLRRLAEELAKAGVAYSESYIYARIQAMRQAEWSAHRGETIND